MAQEIIIIGTQGNPAEVTPKGALKVDLVLDDTSSLAQESTVSSIEANTDPNERTPNFIRPTTASNIAILTYDVAVSNVGTTDGTVLGGLIKPGDTLNFDAGALNNFYAAGTFTYDATDTEFLIIYNS